MQNAAFCSDALRPKPITVASSPENQSRYFVSLSFCATAPARIVAISSVSGIVGNRGQVNYSAAKAGLVGAVKALAVELARHKITVHAVAPGVIETEMADSIEFKDEVKTAIPMRRFGRPEEVAAVVAVLFRQVVIDVKFIVLAEIDFIVIVVVVFAVVAVIVIDWLIVLIIIMFTRVFQGRIDFHLLLDALFEFD